MKHLAVIIVFTLISFMGFSQEKGQTITVTINNINNDKGHVILSLHSSDTFMKGDGIQNEQSEIKDGKIEITFTNVQPGTYAIMAMHDVNDNKAMDFGANGMPKESYGMSNNPMLYGPPEFFDAKFEVDATDVEMTIRF